MPDGKVGVSDVKEGVSDGKVGLSDGKIEHINNNRHV